jgi:hypothetical protein
VESGRVPRREAIEVRLRQREVEIDGDVGGAVLDGADCFASVLEPQPRDRVGVPVGLRVGRPFAEAGVAHELEGVRPGAELGDPVRPGGRQRVRADVVGGGVCGHRRGERQRQLEEEVRVRLRQVKRDGPRRPIDRDSA